MNEESAQRRRLELLVLISTSAQRFKQLSVDGQIGVFERMGSAYVQLGDYGAAASSFDKAMALVPDRGDARYGSLAGRLMEVLLRGRRDEAAVQRIGEFISDEEPNNGRFDPAPLVQAVLSETRSRIDAAADAATFSEALKLVDLMSKPAAGVGPAFAEQLDTARNEVVAKREATIDQLLAAMAQGPGRARALATRAIRS